MMNTIRSFTAEDATVIYGSVIDEAIGDAPARDDRRDRAWAARPRSASRRSQMVPRTGTDDGRRP